MAETIELEVTGFQNLRSQLKDANLEVQKMVALYGELSPQTTAAAQKAAELKDQIDDARDAVAAFTGAGKIEAFGKAIQGVAGAFTAVQGALGLFGVESKDLEKTLLKVQSAMALTQGLAALEDVGRAFGTLKNVAVNAFNGIKAAIGSTGIGLLIIGISAAVMGLVSAFSKAEDAEKKNKDTVDSLNNSYKKLQDTISKEMARNQRDADLKVAQAEQEKKSIAEIAKIREDASLEESRLIIVQMETLQNGYQKRRTAAINAARAEGKDVNKAAQDFQDEYEKQYGELNERLYTLDNERKIATIKTEQDIAAEKKKIADDNKKKREKEIETLNSLNEARRQKEEALTLDELELAKVKYENDLERLKEAKTKELAQEELTAEAKKNIKAKYATEEETLLVNYSKTQQEIIDKRQKESEQKEKEYQDKIKGIRDKELEDQIKNTDDYFKGREKTIIESGEKEEKIAKDLDQLELERLEAQLVNTKDYGEKTVELELAIAQKKKEIRQKEIDEEKLKQETIQNFVFESLNNISDLTSQYLEIDIKNRRAKITNQYKDELESAQTTAKRKAEIEYEMAVAMEELNKQQFENEKAMKVVQATITGTQAAINAYAAGAIFGPQTGALFAAISGIFTAAQIALIIGQSYTPNIVRPPSNVGDGKGSGSQYEQGGLLTGPSHDLGGIRTSLGELEGGEFVVNRRATMDFLPVLEAINRRGNTPGPERQSSMPVIKTYVVASDMTSQQEANAQLSRIARL